jgi:hypothetical protein
MHTIQQLDEMLAEHKEWQGKINFYKSEIEKLSNELISAVATERNSYNMPQVEHFQNQFILQREVLDIMRHEFKQHENAIESHQARPMENLAAMHMSEREKLVTFEKLFKDLRSDFHGFIHKEAFS